MIEALNSVLTAELTAINQYFVHHKMCENWGYARLSKKKYEEVLRKIDKKSVRALVMLALDHWLDGASSKAIKGLDKALKIDPADDLAWTFLGDIHADRQKYDRPLVQ